MIYESVSNLVGNTPLMRLTKYGKSLGANIYAKLEFFNPSGSVKDRTALSMLNDAKLSGRLKSGGTLIEPTSGNTGIALTCLAVREGYRVIIVMPENMSGERIKLLKAYGAQVILTDAKDGMSGAISKAQELNGKIKNSLILGQFENPSNPQAHILTGREIYNDLNGKVDIFVAGIGTGGTLSGAGGYLKSKNPQIKIVGIEPSRSPVLTKNRRGVHGLQGLGAGFVPEVLDLQILDEVISISEIQALKTVKKLAVSEGLFVGISSGAALYAATVLANRKENSGKNIVTLFPDSGERYLSSYKI